MKLIEWCYTVDLKLLLGKNIYSVERTIEANFTTLFSLCISKENYFSIFIHKPTRVLMGLQAAPPEVCHSQIIWSNTPKNFSKLHRIDSYLSFRSIHDLLIVPNYKYSLHIIRLNDGSSSIKTKISYDEATSSKFQSLIYDTRTSYSEDT